MKKSELLKLLEGIDDEGSVDEVLSKSDFAKSLIDGGLTLDAFKEKIAKTSCGWRGKNVIRRNAIIKMHNENYDIEEFKGESPYINNYIEEDFT